MKKDIHPKYETTTVECSCGNKFETKSTLFPQIKVEICSACHPFYTGTQRLVDTAGRVEKFKAKMAKQEQFAAKKAKAKKKGEE